MTAPLRELYPPIEPYDTGFLKVSDVHTLYFEQVGNPQGKPAVVLHGGPGGGTVNYYRQFFDPQVYRIVLFDQRGAGKSTPAACLEQNTTWDLVADIEKLREHLKIDKWLVFGGSWGSTLAIAYAETHPTRVKSLVLRGIFLLRRKELLWFYQEGASWIFPDHWEEYLKPIPEVERGDMISAYLIAKKLECAKAWSVWEMATSRLFVDQNMIKRAAEDTQFALQFSRIECHYFVHGGFLRSDNQLLEDVHKIRHIPTTIVQGRYDMVCPMRSAWDFHNAFPESELIIVPDAGHNAKEPGIVSGLVSATDKYRDL